MAVTVVAVYLAAFTSVARGVSNREAVELAGLATVALLGTIMALMILSRWARYRAGPVVALLRREISPPPFFVLACSLPLLVILFVLMIGLVPAWHEPKIGGTTWPSFARACLVLVVTQCACFVLHSIIRRSLAVCEGGIVRDGAVFTPWRRIQRGALCVDELGRLVYDLPYKRVVAIVPPGQRAAVEALLEEKLGRMSDV